MIAYQPDMAVFAYGLNDSRCGHETESFIADYEQIVGDTRAQLPEALIVLVGPYWNLQYDAEEWAKPEYEQLRDEERNPFGLGGDEIVLEYNSAIAELADRHGGVFVDVYAATEGAPWLLHGDHCHFTDLGQWVIGQTVFATIASSCSFIAAKSLAAAREGGLDIRTTGGTEALPHVIQHWRDVENWRR